MILTATMTKEEMNKVCNLIGELDKNKATKAKKILSENNKYNFGSITIDIHGNTIKMEIDKKGFMNLSSDIAMKLFMMNMTAFMRRFVEKNGQLISPSAELETDIVDNVDDVSDTYIDDDDDIEPAEVESFICDGMLVYNV